MGARQTKKSSKLKAAASTTKLRIFLQKRRVSLIILKMVPSSKKIKLTGSRKQVTRRLWCTRPHIILGWNCTMVSSLHPFELIHIGRMVEPQPENLVSVTSTTHQLIPTGAKSLDLAWQVDEF